MEPKSSMPIYVENIGYNDIYVVNGGRYYCIKPNERKELSEENAEAEKIKYLPDGDLYPTGTQIRSSEIYKGGAI